MRNEIISRLNSNLMDIDDGADLADSLRDLVNDALYYLIEMNENSEVAFKLGDKFVEYITHDTVGMSEYPEAAARYSKEDAKTILNQIVIDVI